jgi:serine/threonine protein kinase
MNDQSMNSTGQLLLLNRICDRFEDSIRNGNCLEIEKILSSKEVEGVGDEFVNKVFRELVALNLAYCDDRDSKANELMARFPVFSQWIGHAASYRQLDAFQSTAFVSPSDTASDSPEIANTIPGYEIVKMLGKGGMGCVYLAVHESTGRKVAIKLVNSTFLGNSYRDNSLRQRFQQEAMAASRLQHDNIVQVYEVQLDENPPWFTMQVINGPSLAQKIKKSPLPPKSAAEWTRQCASAIQCAHDSGVLHRDIKPQNVLIDEVQNRAFVSDFGLAKISGDSVAETIDGQLLGTPSYMSPEQAKSPKGLTEASDIYSLGATLYHSLTGRAPFQAATHLETIRQIHQGNLVAPRTLDPSIPVDLESICLKCLESNPSERYESARALENDLQNYLENRPTIARPMTNLQTAKKWFMRNRVLASAGLAFLSVLALAALISTFSAIGYYRFSEQLKTAKEQQAESRIEAEKVASYLEGSWKSSNPVENGSDVRMLDVLNEAIAKLELDFPEDSVVKFRLKRTFAETAFGVSDYVIAATLYKDCMRIAEGLEGLTQNQILEVWDGYGNSLVHSRVPGNLKLGVSELRSCCTAYQESGLADTALGKESIANFTFALIEDQQYEESRKLCETVIGDVNIEQCNADEDRAILHYYLMTLSVVDPHEALTLYEKILPYQKEQFGDDYLTTALTFSYGQLLMRATLLDKAVAEFQAALKASEELLGEAHERTLNISNSLGVAYSKLGKPRMAAERFESNLEKHQQKLGDDHPNTWRAARLMAAEKAKAGDTAGQIEMLEKYLENARQHAESNQDACIRMLNGLSSAYAAADRHAESLPLLEEVVGMCERFYGPKHNGTLANLHNLAGAYRNLEDYESAIVVCEKLIPRLDVLPKKNSLLHSSLELAAMIYAAAGRKSDALNYYDELIKIGEEVGITESRKFKRAIEKRSKLLGHNDDGSDKE